MVIWWRSKTVSDSYKRFQVDVLFDFVNSAAVAGRVINIGQTANYVWESENQVSSTAYKTAPDEVLEIEGLEVFGPMGTRLNNAGTANYVAAYRQKLEYVRLAINGIEHDLINFNERMAGGQRSGGQVTDYSHDMYDGQQCMNIGKGILAGGDPWEAALKVNPGQNVDVHVGFPIAAEGGDANITQPMLVRLHCIKVKGEQKLIYLLGKGRELMGARSLLNANGSIDQSFMIGDLETAVDMPPQLVEKSVPNDRAFKITDFSQLHGGNDCSRPKVRNYITFADNSAATNPNVWYEFTQEGVRVDQSFQEMKWLYDQYNALKIDYIGVVDHHNLRYLRLYRQGRAPEQVYRVDPGRNGFPMPRAREMNGFAIPGPAKLSRPFWLWNELGSLQIRDNGTSINSWLETPGVDQRYSAEVAFWGTKYELAR
jgi:hypothetical protein